MSASFNSINSSNSSISSNRWTRSFSRAVITAAAFGALVLAGCVEDEDEPNPGPGPGGGSEISVSWLDNNNWTIGRTGQSLSYTCGENITVPNGKTLKIMPGTVITFTANGSGITVQQGGGVQAIGSPVSRIVLKRQLTTATSKWTGFRVYSNEENILEYVDIIDAGYGDAEWNSAIYLEGGTMIVNNCVIDGSGNNGIGMEGAGRLIEFSDNAITNSGKAPIYLWTNLATMRSVGTGNTFAGNAEPYVRVRTDDVGQSMTLRNIGIPYYLHAGLSILGDRILTIDPGVEILLNGNTNIRVTGDGKIHALGTALNRIVFRSSSPAAQSGWWNGIDIRTTSPSSVFKYVDISGGGRADGWNENNCLFIWDGAFVELHDVKIMNSPRYGIGLDGDDYNIYARDVEFVNIAEANVWYEDGRVLDELPENNLTPTM